MSPIPQTSYMVGNFFAAFYRKMAQTCPSECAEVIYRWCLISNWNAVKPFIGIVHDLTYKVILQVTELFHLHSGEMSFRIQVLFEFIRFHRDM